MPIELEFAESIYAKTIVIFACNSQLMQVRTQRDTQENRNRVTSPLVIYPTPHLPKDFNWKYNGRYINVQSQWWKTKLPLL